jgi:hypothetical protein
VLLPSPRVVSMRLEDPSPEKDEAGTRGEKAAQEERRAQETLASPHAHL